MTSYGVYDQDLIPNRGMAFSRATTSRTTKKPTHSTTYIVCSTPHP